MKNMIKEKTENKTRIIYLIEKYKSIICDENESSLHKDSLKERIKKLLEFAHYCLDKDVRETDEMVLHVFYCLCCISCGKINGFMYYHYAIGWNFNTTKSISIDYIKKRNKKVYLFLKEIENDINNMKL